MVIYLERCADLHMAQLMPLPLAVSCSVKSRLVLPFWYQLTRVVPEKGPLNGCVCVCANNEAIVDVRLWPSLVLPPGGSVSVRNSDTSHCLWNQLPPLSTSSQSLYISLSSSDFCHRYSSEETAMVHGVSPERISYNFLINPIFFHTHTDSGKSGPKDQVALHYYYTSPSHWCTTHEVSKL